MNDRERLHACLNYEPVDHGIFTLPWLGFDETIEVWKEQGFRVEDLANYPADQWHWFTNWYFPHPPFEYEVVEEDERHILYVNHEGILMRELKTNRMSSMPQFVRFPVETREDFRKFAKERLQPDIAARIGGDWAAMLREKRTEPKPLWIIADRWGGFFGPLRNLLGVEALCMAFYTDPDFVEEMMDTIADYVIAMTDQLLDVVEIDVFGLWEDMAYNHGPLISPDLVRQYMLPRYKRVVEHLKGRGVPWVCLDSDGQIETLVPVWMDAGIDLIYPFEAAAGNDVVAMRKRFGRDLRMYMGIDKRILVAGPEAIDAELQRLCPLIEEGGFIPNIDHSVPPNVPYAHFQYFLKRLMATLGVTAHA